jgi:hypothetical protein
MKVKEKLARAVAKMIHIREEARRLALEEKARQAREKESSG